MPNCNFDFSYLQNKETPVELELRIHLKAVVNYKYNNGRHHHHHTKGDNTYNKATASKEEYTVIQVGILPLSFLKNMASYNGMLIRLIYPEMIICSAIWSKAAHPLIMTMVEALIKQYRLSRASVVGGMNIGDGTANSITSCLYLLRASSSMTLLVISNPASEMPKDFRMMTMTETR